MDFFLGVQLHFTIDQKISVLIIKSLSMWIVYHILACFALCGTALIILLHILFICVSYGIAPGSLAPGANKRFSVGLAK